MTPDYIEALADRADPDQLWRLGLLDQLDLPPEKRAQLDTGVALRRHASHIKQLDLLRQQRRSLLITPLGINSAATMSVDVPVEHMDLMRHG